MTDIAAFTILMNFDGYWVIESSIADAVIAEPGRYSHSVIKAPTKLAACRIALALGMERRALELHLEGVGVTHSALTEIRRAELIPVIRTSGRQTNLSAHFLGHL